MVDQRALDAIRRIEGALARIEAVAGSSKSESGEEFGKLRESHQALRLRVEGAIGQIDRILETGTPG
jgi:hypothetical protein